MKSKPYSNKQLGIMPSPISPRDYNELHRRVNEFGFSLDIFREYNIKYDSHDVALSLTVAANRQLARALRQFAYKIQKEGAK